MKDVEIAKLVIAPGRRPVRDVEALADSIQRIGLLNPITVTPELRLVTGRNRVEAFKRLGRSRIPANVVTLDKLHLELAEIDENLVRNELTALERGEQLARRKRIYEALHPETKQGGSRPGSGRKSAGSKDEPIGLIEIKDPQPEKTHKRKSKRNNYVLISGETANEPSGRLTFVEDAAKQTGASRSMIEQDVRIAEKLTPEVREAIRDTPLADAKVELLKLAQVDKADQKSVADRVVSGECATVVQAIRSLARDRKKAEAEARAAAAKEAIGAESESAPTWEIRRGDCLDLFKGIASDSARLVFADPPYNIGIEYGDHCNDSRPADEFQRWCHDWIVECRRILTPDGSLWLLINHEWAWVLCGEAIETIGFHLRQWVTWYESFGVNCTGKFNRCSRALLWLTKDRKRHVFNPEAVLRPSDRQTKYGDKRADPGGKVWDDVWGVNPPIPRLTGTCTERMPEFPTQLPMALLRPIVGCASDPGDLVVDPFCGSGTSGAVAIELGRRFVGLELSEKFAGLARDRLFIVHASLKEQ